MTAHIKRTNPNALSARLAAKLLAFIMALTVMAACLALGIDQAFAASLNPVPRNHVVVKSDQVRLGDVFEGLSKHADFALAPAPAPGEEMVWNQPTLMRIATAFNLKYRPGADTQVRITRAGHIVDSDTIRAIIRDHLASENGHTLYDIRFTGEQPSLSIAGDAFPQLSLADFSLQRHSGNFGAILRATMADGSEHTLNLRGVAERQERVPVLRTPLRNGQVISARDIDYITLRNAELRPGTILNADDLIGATPRRALSQNAAIRMDDIEMPRLVSRGDIITMVYSEGGMRLTARGKAMSDGAMGDVIRVSNTNSNRQIEARVTNYREVSVNH